MTREEINKRILTHAKYYVEHSSTCREVSKHFGLSKSQVHNNLAKNLKELDNKLYLDVRNIMDTNKKECHLRGGLATKRKYDLMKTPN